MKATMSAELLKLLETPEGAELIRKTLAAVLQGTKRPEEYPPKKVAELAGVAPRPSATGFDGASAPRSSAANTCSSLKRK